MGIFKIDSFSCIEWKIKPCEGIGESQLAWVIPINLSFLNLSAAIVINLPSDTITQHLCLLANLHY